MSVSCVQWTHVYPLFYLYSPLSQTCQAFTINLNSEAQEPVGGLLFHFLVIFQFSVFFVVLFFWSFCGNGFVITCT